MVGEPIPLVPFITGVPEETLALPRDSEIRTLQGDISFGNSLSIPAAKGMRIHISSMIFNVTGTVSISVTEGDIGFGETSTIKDIQESTIKDFLDPYKVGRDRPVTFSLSGGGSCEVTVYFRYSPKN